MAFKALLRRHAHHQITPEIRRELFQSVSRDQKTSLMMDTGDDEDVDAMNLDD